MQETASLRSKEGILQIDVFGHCIKSVLWGIERGNDYDAVRMTMCWYGRRKKNECRSDGYRLEDLSNCAQGICVCIGGENGGTHVVVRRTEGNSGKREQLGRARISIH